MNGLTAYCANCGHPLSGAYCSQCGEKKFSETDKSIRHLFEEAGHFITHLDNKFFKTFRLVFTRPGLVSTDYCNGIQKRHFKPLSFFLVAVLLYLLFPLLQGLNMSFATHVLNFSAIGIPLDKWAAQKAAAQSITIEQLGAKFDAVSGKLAKILLLLILPLSGWVLKGLFRKRRHYYFDHFILATELNSFYIYGVYFIIPLSFLLVDAVIDWFTPVAVPIGDIVTLPLYLIGFTWASAVAFKRFYSVSWLQAVSKALLFLLAHSLLLYFVYRLILFVVVLLFI